MPNFKPKTKKKIRLSKKLNVTLDNKHNEKMQNFKNIHTSIIPDLLVKKKEIKKTLKKDISLETKLELEDQLREIRKKVKKLKTEKKKYLLDNSKYIFTYFEKKKKVSEGITVKKKKILHNFFNSTDKNEIVKKNDDQNKDLNKYLSKMDESLINLQNYSINYDMCNCGGELIHVDYKGLLICNKCGIQVPFLVEHEKPSYKEPPKEVCFYAYKRINHFREILAQFQAKETTQIPDDVIKNIKSQIIKERISLSDITNKKAKDILKKLGYNKYYEHIPFIKDKLGIKPPVMSPELEDKLCNLFMEIQKPYAKSCPDDRVNFLNYYYVLYKMCELLNENKFLPFFPMLKDPIKRIEQDEIWKKICKELYWEFIPTI